MKVELQINNSALKPKRDMWGGHRLPVEFA